MLMGRLQGHVGALTKGYPFEVEIEVPEGEAIKFMVRAPTAASTSDFLAAYGDKQTALAAFNLLLARGYTEDDSGKEAPILRDAERASFLNSPFYEQFFKAAIFIRAKDIELQGENHKVALEAAKGNSVAAQT